MKQQVDENILIKRVREAIYNTWHSKGIANVDGVAAIAVKALRPYTNSAPTHNLKGSTQSCINDIFSFLMSGDIVSFLLDEEIDITEFYAGINVLKDKVIWTNKPNE
jgi:hypothetical protein